MKNKLRLDLLISFNIFGYWVSHYRRFGENVVDSPRNKTTTKVKATGESSELPLFMLQVHTVELFFTSYSRIVYNIFSTTSKSWLVSRRDFMKSFLCRQNSYKQVLFPVNLSLNFPMSMQYVFSSLQLPSLVCYDILPMYLYLLFYFHPLTAITQGISLSIS